MEHTRHEESALFDAVDGRATLVGSNRLEILLFSLGTGENFGINVFKVREVSRTPFITRTPNMPAGVEGLISLRGNVIPVLSLGAVLGLAAPGAPLGAAMMVTEYSKRTLGFLVESVDRIVRVEWNRVRAPENLSTGAHSFITAITELDDGRLVSILDVESILADTFGEAVVGDITPIGNGHEVNVFFVDDSTVARRKITEVLDRLGVRHKHATNGLEAWNRLDSLASHADHAGQRLSDEIDMIMLDAEMPEMDGYVLTRKIKGDARFTGIPVVMHSSLSSEANRAMGTRVGVDAYVAKFDAEVLAETIRPMLQRARRAS
jgi:two-component system chemotaxis response regulator CheV